MKFTLLNITSYSSGAHPRNYKYTQSGPNEIRTCYWLRKRFAFTKHKPRNLHFRPLSMQIRYEPTSDLTYLPTLTRHSNLAPRLSAAAARLQGNFLLTFRAPYWNSFQLWYARYLRINFTLCKMLLGLTFLRSSLTSIGSHTSKPFRPKTESLLTITSTLLV